MVLGFDGGNKHVRSNVKINISVPMPTINLALAEFCVNVVEGIPRAFFLQWELYALEVK